LFPPTVGQFWAGDKKLSEREQKSISNEVLIGKQFKDFDE
jgi:hypothetical protein